MKEELLQPHSIVQFFTLGFRIYRTNFIPILILSLSLLIPSIVTALLGLEIEHIVFFITIRLTEAAMTLGLITLMFQSIFPTVGILKCARTRLMFRTIHIATLQFIIFLVGSMFAVLPFPFNLLLFLLLIGSIFAFSLAQTIHILEGERGFRALVASFQLVRSNVVKTTVTIVLLGVAKLMLFSFLFLSLMPDLDLNSPESFEKMQNLLVMLQAPEVLQALRWSQYLGYLLLYPFASIVLVLLYFDLKLAQSTIDESALHETVANLLTNGATEPSPDEVENPTDSQ